MASFLLLLLFAAVLVCLFHVFIVMYSPMSSCNKIQEVLRLKCIEISLSTAWRCISKEGLKTTRLQPGFFQTISQLDSRTVEEGVILR